MPEEAAWTRRTQTSFRRARGRDPCYLKNRDRSQARNDEEFFEAAEWLTSDEESGPFSYVRVCEALGIHPDRLRTGIHNHNGRLVEIRD